MDYTFDLQRIFFGDAPLTFLLEIAFRTAFLFVFTLLALRFVGQRGIAQLTLFDFSIIIALGSAVGDPMFYPDVPLTHGMVVIVVVVALQRLLTAVTNRHPHIEMALDGKPVRIVADGLVDLKGKAHAGLSVTEVYMELREREVVHLGQVRRAFFEPDGKVSVYFFDGDDVRPGLPLFPPDDTDPMLDHVPAPEDADYACKYCGNVVHYKKGEQTTDCPRCDEHLWRKVWDELPVGETSASTLDM